MELSVIIVSYKGWNKLIACLEALGKFSGRSFSMEVIIVDNRSDDPFLDEIRNRFPSFRFIINERNGGYANGCNLGFRHSSGDNILILNPDTVAGEKAVESMLVTLKSMESIYILTCRQHTATGKEAKAAGKFPGFFNKEDKKNQGKLAGDGNSNSGVSYPDWVSGSVMMFRRDIYEQLKGFDEDFWMYYEDVDICRRARLSGGQVAMLNDVSIEHNHGGSSRINKVTTATTKCEVQVSRHLYFHKHMRGLLRFTNHFIAVSDNLIPGFLAFLAGLVLFPVTSLRVRVLLFLNLVKYYLRAIYRRSWLSARSVNFS